MSLNVAQTYFQTWFLNNWWWLAIILAAVIVLIVVICLLANKGKRRRKKTKTPKRKIVKSAYIDALGGEDNFVSSKLERSRIVLQLKNYDLLDKEKLKEAGVDGFIMMSDRLTLVIKGQAEEVYKTIFGETEN